MTSALLSEALAPLRADPTRAAILLDIDGTLAPIVERAADARVPPHTRRLLAEIARRYGVVACVSGRRASEARAMVAIGTISYLGSHGAEILRAGWTEPVVDPELEDWTQRIHDFAREADTAELRRLRVRLEDKGPIVAFHWRGSPDEEAARAAIDAVAARAETAGLRTHWGRKVLEVRPPVRIDKGAGIETFLADTIGVKKHGYKTWEKKIRVSSGTVNLSAELEPEVKAMSAEVTPTTTPEPEESKQRTGAASEHPVAPPSPTQKAVNAGTPENSGTVSLASDPSGAEVYVDDSMVGKAPVTLNLKPGQHYVRMFAKDYRNWSQQIMVVPGSELMLTAKLQKSD